MNKHHIEEVLEISKASLLKKIDREYDREEATRAGDLLRRRGKYYTLAEIEFIAGFMVSSHDACVFDNPEDYSALEVYQAKQIHARYDRVLEKLEAMLGEPPVFGLMPRGTSSVPE